MRKFLAVMTLAAMAAATTPASAYTSYLKPSEYWPDDRSISIEGSYANQFFTPEIALPAEITITNPAGQVVPFNRLAVGSTATNMEATLLIGGTYRISTGEIAGAPATLVGVDGQWRSLAAGETPPEGAPVTTLQAITLSETYVTRGRASRDTIDQPRGRLSVRPVTHPNQVLAANGLEVEVLFDGAPLANSAIVLYADGDVDTDLDTFAVTDAAGRAMISLPAPGHYVIAARHRAQMPEGAPAQIGSYTTTLTFEALAELPVESDVTEREETREPRRPRRRIGRPDY